MSLSKQLSDMAIADNKIDADVLECPICLETCMPPSFTCDNGHLICGGCRQSGNIVNCPVCRNERLTLSNDLKPYLEICYFSCINGEKGCSEKIKGINKLRVHESNCKYRDGRCYVSSCKLAIPKLNIEQHIKTTHSDRAFWGPQILKIKTRISGQKRDTDLYYFTYNQRVYVVTLEYKTGIQISAKALNDGKLSPFLRVNLILENAKGKIIAAIKHVNQSHESPNERTMLTISGEDELSYCSSKSDGNLSLHVSFLRVGNTYDPGCSHYRRNCKLICPLPQCGKVVSCRECHDSEIQTHQFDRFALRQVICCSCGKMQAPTKECGRCQQKFARYFCPKCNLYDDERTVLDIFHCDHCGICRRKESRNTTYYHCGCCDICLPESSRDTHKCTYRAAKKNCTYCGKDMHSSRVAIVAMNCGHYVHSTCRNQNHSGQTGQNCRECDTLSILCA